MTILARLLLKYSKTTRVYTGSTYFGCRNISKSAEEKKIAQQATLKGKYTLTLNLGKTKFGNPKNFKKHEHEIRKVQLFI